VLAELERVADYLVLVIGGQVRLDGTVDDLTARHRLVTGPARQPVDPTWTVIQSSRAGAQQHLLVRLGHGAQLESAGWQARTVGVEELALAYLRDTVTATELTPVGSSK
jgi:ABC-2 type transport system ATP-binding protein